VIAFDASGRDGREPAPGRQGTAVARLDRPRATRTLLWATTLGGGAGRPRPDAGRRSGARDRRRGRFRRSGRSATSPGSRNTGSVATCSAGGARAPSRARCGLASILPDADRWYDPATVDRPSRRALAAGELPDLQATRDFLVESLETTLELLAGVASEDDASLYFHRLALFHEEMHVETFAVVAQTLGIAEVAASMPRIASHAARPALFFPATRWLLGASAPGFRFDNEVAGAPGRHSRVRDRPPRP
jgi:hypothetical protein